MLAGLWSYLGKGTQNWTEYGLHRTKNKSVEWTESRVLVLDTEDQVYKID